MADTSSIVKWAVHDGVGTLTMNRPQHRNALSVALIEGMLDRLHKAAQNDAVRVVVLTGAGERAFCAGGDLAGGMAGSGLGLPAQIAKKGLYVQLIQAIQGLGKPVIARLNGHAYGGGVGLMLACHLVVAHTEIKVGLPEITVGLWPMMVTALLVRHVGRKTAAELMLLGEKLTATEARALGLINRVVPQDALDATADALAQTLASRSPAVLKLGLDAFEQTADLPQAQALWSLRDRLLLITLLDDAAEGITAFLEKRPPRWTGR